VVTRGGGPPPKRYFPAVDGTVWRVHDCVFEKGRFRPVDTANAKTTSRVFVAANGVKKSYRFTRGESHELTESRLEAQLQKAGYLPTERYNPSEREAR
jgi:hypothetical protein